MRGLRRLRRRNASDLRIVLPPCRTTASSELFRTFANRWVTVKESVNEKLASRRSSRVRDAASRNALIVLMLAREEPLCNLCPSDNVDLFFEASAFHLYTMYSLYMNLFSSTRSIYWTKRFSSRYVPCCRLFDAIRLMVLLVKLYTVYRHHLF